MANKKRFDMNVVHVTGRLGRKPEIRNTTTGKKVCSVSLACADGEQTQWLNLVFWEQKAELISQYCDKGSFIRVTGRLQTRTWDKDGVKQYSTEVVAADVQFLGDKQAAAPRQDVGYATPQQVADEMGGKIVQGGDYPKGVEGDLPF